MILKLENCFEKNQTNIWMKTKGIQNENIFTNGKLEKLQNKSLSEVVLDHVICLVG